MDDHTQISILILFEKRMLQPLRTPAVSMRLYFNPHPLRKEDATTSANVPSAFLVSISILILFEKRMLPYDRLGKGNRAEFQSSSSSKRGCYLEELYSWVPDVRFQSSSSSKRGCYELRATGAILPLYFNPHPLRKEDAT